ncbi:OmpA family protein [Thioalkalivibrio sp. ALE16]|uniref:OmpA family protein n=1 Tax=Thioalkalivibrio sp. ALE16 TaxID=1158172 RepID=UPI00037B19DB|nr:OmpA family protein [Thioalkalivibrio sp. ALE16]
MKGRLLATSIALALLSGCAAMPPDRDRLPDTDALQADRQLEWAEKQQPVTKVRGRAGIEVSNRYPLTGAVADTEISLRFPHNATLTDLVGILNAEGIPATIRQGATDTEDAGDFSGQPIGLAQFDGTVGGLVRVLQEVRDVAVEYRGGYVVLRPDSRYILSAPQNEDLVERLAAQIEDLGGTSVRGELDAGVITYRATPNAHDDIEQYIERAARNAAVVHLQMALIDVRLNRERRQGFNWNELAIQLGDLVNTDLDVTGNATSLTRQGISFSREIPGLSIGAVVNALSEYGDARTEQDITLTTLAGAEVEIRSGNQVPFVGEVTSTAVRDTGSTTGATVEVQQTGLNVSIVPRYDASTDLVTSRIEMDLTDVVQMREFDVGVDGATLTSPELQDLAFTNISRLRPGEATLIGGVAYDQVDKNYTSLAGLEDKAAGSERISTDRHAMFILLRPTVTVFLDESDEDFEEVVQDDRIVAPGPATACDPDAVAVSEDENIVDIRAVYFEPDTDRLQSPSLRYLTGIADEIQAEPRHRYVLAGYHDTGPRGTADGALAEQRAEQALRTLGSHGAPLGQVETLAVGACGLPNEVSAEDRRVEIWQIAPSSESGGVQ